MLRSSYAVNFHFVDLVKNKPFLALNANYHLESVRKMLNLFPPLVIL